MALLLDFPERSTPLPGSSAGANLGEDCVGW